MPRDDARRWSRKIERIIKSSLAEEEDDPKKKFDEDYQRKILERIHKGKSPEKTEK